MKEPEEIETMAYIAGLIDGDGCIMLSKMNTKGRGVQYRPVLQIHNACRKMPAFVHRILGGTLACDKPKKEGYKPIWKWMLQGREECLDALEKLSAFLVIKKDSALALIEYLKSEDAHDGKESFLGDKAYSKLKDLNMNRKINPIDLEKRRSSNSSDPCFWAYLAGLMDTDGSFSTGMYIRKPSEENRQKNDLVKYKPIMQLTLVTGDAINYIVKNCEFGSCYVVKAKTSLRGIAYKFCVNKRIECIEFIKKIIPYMHVKINQAVILLDFCRNYTPSIGLNKIPEEESAYREFCHKEIVRLNNTPS